MIIPVTIEPVNGQWAVYVGDQIVYTTPDQIKAEDLVGELLEDRRLHSVKGK